MDCWTIVPLLPVGRGFIVSYANEYMRAGQVRGSEIYFALLSVAKNEQTQLPLPPAPCLVYLDDLRAEFHISKTVHQFLEILNTVRT